MMQLKPLTANPSDLQEVCSSQQASSRKKHPRIVDINSSDRPGIASFNKSDHRLPKEFRKRSWNINDRTKYIEQWLQTHKNNLPTSNNSSPSSVSSSSIVYESPPQLRSTKKNQRSPLKDCNQLKRFKANDSEKVNSLIITHLHYSPVKTISARAKENNLNLASPKKLPRKNIVDQYEDNLIIESCMSPINSNPVDESPVEIIELSSPAPSSLFLESVHSDCNSPHIEEIQSLSSPRIAYDIVNIDDSDDANGVNDEDFDLLDETIHSDCNKTISGLENLDGSLIDIDIDEIQSEKENSVNQTIDSDETFFSEFENVNCTVIDNKVDDDCDNKSVDERYTKVVIDDDDDEDEISNNEIVISEVTSQSLTNIDSAHTESFSIDDHSDLSQRIVEREPSVEEISQKISQGDASPPPGLNGNNSTNLENIISVSSSPLSKQSSRVERDTIINAVVKKKKKKKPKKGSLVERLQTLVARKVSSVRIWRHQMSQDHLKTNSPCVTVQIDECICQYSRCIVVGRVINDDSDLIGRCIRENSLGDKNKSDANGATDGNNKKLFKRIKLLLVPELVGKINFNSKNIIKVYPPWDIINLSEIFLNIFYFIVATDSNLTGDNHESRNKMKLVKEFKCPCLNEKKLSENCGDKFSKLKPSFMEYLFNN